ncbi:hypothetical protein NPIL_119661 [Nephila pilipes]|uniref:Uncharacterized protein n=1 Tax=Nephila pilipes TaxID=299642 RepID=A0A8X6QVJ2_NEPPI|nr:hypothetical protein NPIL_237331 [Nephila pilipes]GFU38862.1 hypothetical protein NPIL_119661 [Nephila pilipes]
MMKIIVYAMRCIRKGNEYAVIFWGIMSLPQPPTKFLRLCNPLLQAFGVPYEKSMPEAVREAVDEMLKKETLLGRLIETGRNEAFL